MPLAIKQEPKRRWTDRISEVAESFGRFELFILILIGLLLLAGGIIQYFSLLVIVFYFAEKWEIIEYLKEIYHKK